MTRVTALRRAFVSRDPRRPISTKCCPHTTWIRKFLSQRHLCLEQSIPPAPHHILSGTPPDAHRRFNFNLRCASGGVLEGIGRGWEGLVSATTCLLASTELIKQIGRAS